MGMDVTGVLEFRKELTLEYSRQVFSWKLLVVSQDEWE